MIGENKKRICLFVVGVLICSCLLEIFVFNYRYWMNAGVKQKEISMKNKKVNLHDIEMKEGTLIITGDDPYFTIDMSGYCSYIGVKMPEDTLDYNINVCHIKDNKIKQNKMHLISPVYKDIPMLEIKDDLTHVKFVPVISERGVNHINSFQIKKLIIQNDLIINYYRIVILWSSVMLLIILICFRKILSVKIHVTFLLIVVMLGINISLVNPVYYSYDEREHFLRSYETSYLDFELFEKKEIPWIENSEEFLDWRGGQSYQNIAEKNNYMKKFDSSEYTKKVFYASTADTYPFIPYIPGAIGIFLGRTLGFSFAWTFFLGRIVSLLGYAIICSWCIKHIKIGKRLLFMVALLPALLFVATSYSADTYTLASSFVVLTIWINMLMQEEKIKKSQVIGFFCFMSIMIMCKVTYAPLCLLFFAIPKEKFEDKREKWIYRIIVLFNSGVISVLTFLYSNTKDINQWKLPGVDVGSQITSILENPLKYLYVVGNDILTNALKYVSGITNSLAYNEALNPLFMFLLLVLLCVVALIDNQSDHMLIIRRAKIVLFIAITCSWGLVATALYITFTPVGSNFIDGIQGRYWGPLIFPLLLLLRNNKIKNTFDDNEFNYGISLIMYFFVIWTLWSILYHCCG